MVQRLRRLCREKKAREAEGALALEGVRLLEEALAAGLALRDVLVAPALERKARGRELLAALRGRGARLEAATDEVEAGPTNDPELMDKGFKIVRFGADPVILVKVSDNEFRAFAATCTHLDCIVEYRNKEQKLWCNCHNGAYDLNGVVTGGPPPKPLTAYNVHVVQKGSGQPGTVVIAKA